jgi:hypothetical protein
VGLHLGGGPNLPRLLYRADLDLGGNVYARVCVIYGIQSFEVGNSLWRFNMLVKGHNWLIVGSKFASAYPHVEVNQLRDSLMLWRQQDSAFWPFLWLLPRIIFDLFSTVYKPRGSENTQNATRSLQKNWRPNSLIEADL